MDRLVVGVRTDQINVPEPHEHPIMVKLDDDSELAPGDVIEAIDNGDRFLVMVEDWTGNEHVNCIHIHECPICGAEPYLCGGGQVET